MNSRVLQSKEAISLVLPGSTENRRLGIVVLVSLVLIVPIAFFGIPSNLDLSNHFRFALPFYDAIASGDLYPGWLAESNSGYGDPSFRFYPPALYYLLAITRLIIGDWYAATVVTYSLVAVAAGLGMYFWTKAIFPASTAVMASCFYAFAPYHINQLYQATLLAEWAGSAVLPFAFGFVERVCRDGRRRDIAGLAATYALLVFTHLPLTVIGSIALFAYALARIEKDNGLQTLLKLGAGIALGLVTSATYWVTMVSELKWIGINEVERDSSVDYRFNFILSTLSPSNLNVWWMNVILLLTVLLFAPVVMMFVRRDFRVGLKRPAVVLSVLALFMTLPLSRPVWYLLSPLQQTQFPWRWLAIISMGGSVLAAFAVSQLSSPRMNRQARLLIIGAMTISVAFSLSHLVREAMYLNYQGFENTLTTVRGSASVNYWFPIWARSNPRQMERQIESGDRLVTVESWQPEQRKFSISAGEKIEVRVRTFYYPHWVATSNGQTLATRPDKDGALLITVPQDATSVALDFREPKQSSASSLASAFGFAIVLGLGFPSLRRRKI